MKSNKLWLIVVLVLALIIIVLSVLLFNSSSSAPAVTAAPNVATPTGNVPIPDASSTPPLNAPLSKGVTVSTPAAAAIVSKVIPVKGSAPGNWYFEATFPIQVRDQADVVIGRGVAQAQGNWMTTGQVPFVGKVTVTNGYTGPATLAIIRDNPSGLPENDDSVTIPIIIQ